MIKFIYKIEEVPWKITLLAQEEYEMLVDSYSEAEVDLNQKQATFNYNRITREVVEHEVTHIYFDACCLRSVDSFSIEQIEEIVAEFVPRYGRKIIKVSQDLKKIIDKKILEE